VIQFGSRAGKSLHRKTWAWSWQSVRGQSACLLFLFGDRLFVAVGAIFHSCRPYSRCTKQRRHRTPYQTKRQLCCQPNATAERFVDASKRLNYINHSKETTLKSFWGPLLRPAVSSLVFLCICFMCSMPYSEAAYSVYIGWQWRNFAGFRHHFVSKTLRNVCYCDIT